MITLVLYMFLMMSPICLGGCALGEIAEEKQKDLEYTVVAQDDIPEKLQEVIAEKEEKAFQISFTLGDALYIAVGYGEQQTGGYSICVNGLYETENAIVIDTTLIGPDSGEKAAESASYPYLVVKTEAIADKPIEFK